MTVFRSHEISIEVEYIHRCLSTPVFFNCSCFFCWSCMSTIVGQVSNKQGCHWSNLKKETCCCYSSIKIKMESFLLHLWTNQVHSHVIGFQPRNNYQEFITAQEVKKLQFSGVELSDFRHPEQVSEDKLQREWEYASRACALFPGESPPAHRIVCGMRATSIMLN